MIPPVDLPMAAAPNSEVEEAVEPGGGSRRFRVEGMDCAACAQTVRKRVVALDGVRSAEVFFGAAAMTIEGDESDSSIVAAVERAGYRAYPAGARRSTPARPFWRRDTRTVLTIASVPLLLAAVVATLIGAPDAVANSLYVISMLVGGLPIGRAAVASLRVRALDMNVLMTLAAVGAIAIGAYAEAAWVLVLFAVGTTLETFALDRTRRAVEALMELAPTRARVVVDGREQTVPVDQVKVGDRVVVRPGERLPIDGSVVRGRSSVDQSPITGESVPVDVEAGDDVFAGSLAVLGTLTITATAPASDSTLSRIAELVEQAQGSEAPAQRFIDRFAAIYTPIVFGAAIVLAVGPPLVAGADFDTWAYRALALLIVACPCSLVISVPVAVVSAIGGAARTGVIVAGGLALERLGRIDTVAFDKTGTLTLGKFELREIEPVDRALDEKHALTLMAALEDGSEHPLATAITQRARERGWTLPPTSEFRALPGRGAEAIVDGRSLWAGSPRMVLERTGASPPGVERMQKAGLTALVLGEGDRALAVFGVADKIRPEARTAIAATRQAGVGRTLMLTGDNEPVAARIASQAGLDQWRSELLPEDKLKVIEELRNAGAKVAMVGDGINDAPALAKADIGIAMGAAGSDIALQSADVALLSDQLDRLPSVLRRARQALSIMRFNVAASLIVKAGFVILAPLGLVSLVMAVAADMGMSLLVTLNALRLLGQRAAK